VINKLVLENLKQRPIRTSLSVLLIGVPVTLMLTLVGLSEGTLRESAERQKGVGADILIRPPGTSPITLSSAPLPQSMVAMLSQWPHVSLASGTIIAPLSGWASVTGVDFYFHGQAPFQASLAEDTAPQMGGQEVNFGSIVKVANFLELA